jgi:hypothetical protein
MSGDQKGTGAEKLSRESDDSARYSALAAQRQRVEELAAACDLDERALLRELRDHEIHVTSVWDFIASGGAPPRAVPILVAHLSMDHHERIWEGIVRALAVQHARASAFGVLSELYRKEGSRHRRSALAHAIAAMARFDEVGDLPEIEVYRSLFR